MGFLKDILAMAFISKSRYEEDKDKADEYAYPNLMEELEEDDHELDDTDEEEYTEDFIYHHLDS